MAKRGIICQGCGVEAPCQYVEFHYNIGMLVARQHRFIKGVMCKRCIHKNFWSYTLKDITLGWWGYISLVLTPIFLVQNIVRYIGAAGLAATPANAAKPQLTQDAIARLERNRQALIDRLNAKEDFLLVAESVAKASGVTPGQVVLYVRALSKPAAAPTPAPAQPGFPVIMPPAPPPIRTATGVRPAPPRQPAAAPPPVPASQVIPENELEQIPLEPAEEENEEKDGLGV